MSNLTEKERRRLFPLWIEGEKLRVGDLIEQDRLLWEEIARKRGRIAEYEEELASLTPIPEKE